MSWYYIKHVWEFEVIGYNFTLAQTSVRSEPRYVCSEPRYIPILSELLEWSKVY